MKTFLVVMAVLGAAFGLPGPPAYSQSASDFGNLSREVAQLKEQVSRLTGRLEALETLKPTFATFMPEFSERFHVMHRAGDVGDWAVAAHELLEIRRLVRIAGSIDPEQARLLAAFMNGPLANINAAIEHASQKKFRKALIDTVTNCNACHKAVGSPFVKVALDADRMLSMRHAHALKKSRVTKGHTHGH